MEQLLKEVKTAVFGRTIIFAIGVGALASGPHQRSPAQSRGADQAQRNSSPRRPDESKGGRMKKTSLLLILTILATVASLGVAGASNGGPCPDSSHNRGATPP